jgi:hypothetical protein
MRKKELQTSAGAAATTTRHEDEATQHGNPAMKSTIAFEPKITAHKKARIAAGFFSIWLPETDSNRRPSD